MKKIVLVSMIIILVSCSSQKKAMDSWIGSTKQQLIMSWGPPTKISDDGAGGEILVYARQIYTPGYNNTMYDNYGGAHSSYIQGLNYWEYKFFFFDTNGKIYHWLIQKQRIAPQQIDLNIYKR